MYQLSWLPHSPAAGERPDRPDPATGPEPVVHRDLAALCAAAAEGALGPGTAAAEIRTPGYGGAARLADTVAEHRSLLRKWLADPLSAGRRLALITRGAVAAAPGEDVSGPAAAAVRGLVRAVQCEHPGRLLLIDTDGTGASLRALPAASAGDEPELALRDGRALVPRLTEYPARPPAAAPVPLDAAGTVLITGGTAAPGVTIARHLAARHGARRLLLTRPRGPETPGLSGLAAQLRGLGAEVTVTVCEPGDRAALAAVLAAVPERHPLTAVVHGEGGFPGADMARHLHELTRDTALSMFVLCPSPDGVVARPGHEAAAAAGAFLSALAQHRRAVGLPATALVWDSWRQPAEAGEGEDSGEGESRTVPGHPAFRALTADEALAGFDTAVAAGEALLLPAPLDPEAVRHHYRDGGLPPVLRHPAARPAPPEPPPLAELARFEEAMTVVLTDRVQRTAVAGRLQALVRKVTDYRIGPPHPAPSPPAAEGGDPDASGGPDGAHGRRAAEHGKAPDTGADHDTADHGTPDHGTRDHGTPGGGSPRHG
ncbi:beta-ketoacyl reductase [Streptomyces sp. NPDC003691]